MENNNELNSELAVVFEEILPAIHNAGFKYWVYGGIGVAGAIGKFIRKNEDVDIYVLDRDFNKIKKLLNTLCKSKNSWEEKEARPIKETGRPKFEIYINKIEFLSVVPIYETKNGLEFRFKTAKILSDEALAQELKVIGDYKFFSPPKIIIQTLLRILITERPDLLNENSKRRDDALAVFTEEEFNELEKLNSSRNN